MKKQVLVILFSLVSSKAEAREFLFAGHEFPPLSYVAGNSVEGGMVDVIKMACKKLKHTCRFEIHALARAFKLAEEGSLDGILSLYKAPERAHDFYDTPFIVMTNIVYMGLRKEDLPKVSSLQELSDFNVVSIRGTVLLKIIKGHAEKVKNLNVIEDVNSTIIIQRLGKGFYGPKTLVASAEEVLNFVSQKEGIALQRVYKVEERPFVTSFSKNKMTEKEANAFNKVIEKMLKDGTVKKILEKHNLEIAR